MNTPTLPEAIKVLQDALAEDKERGSYFDSWKANIAMAFFDEYNHSKEKVDFLDDLNIHAIANNAANNFLEMFIKQ